MESKSYFQKAQEFENNQIKECPFCNAILPISEYDDHMFCHQLDQQENGEQSFNINNYGMQLNNNSSQNNNTQQINNIQQINNPNININYNNNNNSSSNNNSNNNNDDFFLFQDNNNNNQNPPPYINPEMQNLNSINIINDNNNNNNQNPPPYINPEIENINSINIINDNNNDQNINQNQNINNTNQNNNYQNNKDIPNPNEETLMDKIRKFKNYFFSPSNNNNNNQNQNNNKRDIMNIPRENLSPEEREERNRIEEQQAYEKKILGIANSESQIKVEKDTRSTGEKISDFVTNNSNSILAVIDVIGCLTLHTPSIGRTIVRVVNFIDGRIDNLRSNNNNQNDNIDNAQLNEYNTLIRAHPELRNKDSDPDTIIKFLPVSEVKEIRNNEENDSNNNNKCIICLCDFEIGDQVSALPCAHVFHTECIASWIKKHCQCPVCKFNITLKSLIG